MMKRLNFGLAVAMALTALVTTTQAFAASNTPQAQALATAAQIPCTVTDSRSIEGLAAANGDPMKIYEVACQEGLGYVLIDKTKTEPARTADCFQANTPTPKGEPSAIACKLPANQNPAASLQPIIAKTGSACVVNKARFIGSTPDKSIYEVACKDGQGLILISPKLAGGPAASTANCLGYEKPSNIQCTLTTHEQRLAIVDSLVAGSGKACTLKDKRYVAQTTTGETFYEIACADGKGYMIAGDNTGKVAEMISCTQAGGIAGGCTLTDPRKAQTEESSLYTQLAKKAGFDCQVAEYAVFPDRPDRKGVEAVELKCSNRPDGGVGLFSGNSGRVFDCLRAPSQGYACTMTAQSALYAKLNGQLKAKNRSSCVVSGARPYDAKTSTTDFVEVACADGAPGWVLEYPTDSDSPKNLLNCTQAGNIGGTGCQLPTNRKK
jgi:hypothetical protein